MIKVHVNTTWKGQVAIRNKYVDEALRRGEGLEIICNKISMVIPADQIRDRIRGKREGIPDKFSNEIHTLYYFIWSIGVKPDEIKKIEVEQKQDKLF